MKKIIVILMVVLMSMLTSSIVEAKKKQKVPVLDKTDCKRNFVGYGRLYQAAESCGFKFNDGEAATLCAICANKYDISKEEAYNLIKGGKEYFNQLAEERGKFRACKETLDVVSPLGWFIY